MVQQNKRTCSICGKEIAKNNGQFCKSCSGKYYSAKLKKQAVEYKGGKCEICGYDKSISALDFHHIDPTEKEFEISRMLKGTFNTIKSELDKCMLLCANCHREIHSTDYDHIIYEYERLIKKHDNGQQIAPKKIITSKNLKKILFFIKIIVKMGYSSITHFPVKTIPLLSIFFLLIET